MWLEYSYKDLDPIKYSDMDPYLKLGLNLDNTKTRAKEST